MLAYFDESGSDPVLVVGGGVPREWLNHTMGIENYRTKYGTVSWHYDDNTLSVTVQGAKGKFNVRTGTSFVDHHTKLNVEFK